MALDSEVLTTIEAAGFLRAHVETIRRLATRGEIPSFKLGKDWRFRKEALIRWSESQRSPSKRPLVLIVDDDPLICKALGRLVKKLGCNICSAQDGREGLTQVARETPDLILLDLLMPNMNGLQFLEELRVTHSDLPVVIVTGHEDSELMHHATKYAPLMVLSKPVASGQLERTVRMMVADKLSVRCTV